MNNQFAVITMFLLVLSTSSGVHAKPLDEMMGEVFDGMITNSVSGSEGPSSQGRMGYYYGGSFKARIPTYDPEIVHITPPNVQTGCNGIDANFGALSYLDGDDLKLLLRNTVQQGATYAFGLALQAMCGSCLAEMKALAAKVNKLSADMLNSCEAGKYAVNSLLDTEWGEDGETGAEALAGFAENWGYGKGKDSIGSKFVKKAAGVMQEHLGFDPTTIFSGHDPYESMRSVAARNPLEALNDKDAYGNPLHTGVVDAMYVNVVYKAVTEADISSWWEGTIGPTASADKDQFNRFIVSLYGSRVFYPMDVGGKDSLASYSWPTLHQDLAELLPSRNQPEVPGSQIQIAIYKCANLSLSSGTYNSHFDASYCLDKESAKEIMSVDNVAGKISGYIQEISDNIGKRDGSEPRAEVKAFMVNDPLQSATFIEMAGPQKDAIAAKLSEWSGYIADRMFLDSIRATNNAVKDAAQFLPMETQKKELKVLTDAFDERLKALTETVAEEHHDTISQLGSIEVFTDLIKAKRENESNKLDDVPSTM